jgi:hypothetical protein
MPFRKMTNQIPLLLLLSMPLTVFAQNQQERKAGNDSLMDEKDIKQRRLREHKEKKNSTYADSAANTPRVSPQLDTTLFNKYANLLNDDPHYNQRSPIWIPAAEAAGVLFVTWAFDRYVLNADYARLSIQSWKRNLRYGPEWDEDKFGINFIGHPYSGALSFQAGRANGYNFMSSTGFALFGSILWEYFGENTRPSYNDLINTPVNGAFLGEVLYRISSNILDDRTAGTHRAVREIAAGLVSPVRGINRLIDGKAFRVTNKEVYQEEPLNITLLAGFHQRNSEQHAVFGEGESNPIVNIQLDYGNPFEDRKRKPFDYFRLRLDLTFRYGRKIIDNAGGYGFLAGRNTSEGNFKMLSGLFQHYDYWDNYSFELGTIGFGPGVITSYLFNAFGAENIIYTNLHAAIVPLAGKNKETGVEPMATKRDYHFGYGAEAKAEVTLNIGSLLALSFGGYYYYTHTFTGNLEDAFLGILKPRAYFRTFRNIHIGFEHTMQNDDSYGETFDRIHTRRTEQKFFVMLFLEDKQRKGKYR